MKFFILIEFIFASYWLISGAVLCSIAAQFPVFCSIILVFRYGGALFYPDPVCRPVGLDGHLRRSFRLLLLLLLAPRTLDTSLTISTH